MDIFKGRVQIKSIQAKFMLVVGALVIFSAIVSNGLVVNLMEKRQQEEILNVFKSDVNGISKSINYLMENEALKLDRYIYDDEFIKFVQADENLLRKKEKNLIETQNYIGKILKKHIENEPTENEFLINTKGTIVAASDERILMLDVSDRDYFKSMKNGENIYISDTIKSKGNDNYINVIVKPIYNRKGKFIGALGKNVIADAYTELLSEYNQGRYTVYLTDKKGNIIYHVNKEHIGKLMGIKEIDDKSKINPDKINVVLYDYEGESKLALCGVIPGVNWYVYSSGYLEDMNQGAKEAAEYACIILILVLIVSLAFTYFIARQFAQPIKRLTSHMDTIAQGDLSNKIQDINTKDETKQLANEINSTTEKLANIVKNVQESAKIVSEQSEKLSAIGEEVAASNIEITKAMNEIAQKTCAVAEQGQESMDYTTELEISLNNLENNNGVMINQSGEVVNSLEESSEKIKYLVNTKKESIESFTELKSTVQELFSGITNISSFLDSIKNIANQIDLLALNAAIEAARAGDAGRGFAVVSNEIKSLSNDTQCATDSIMSIINQIQVLVDKTKDTLNNTEKISNEEGEAFGIMEVAFDNMQDTLNRMINVTEQISENIEIVNDKKTKGLSAISQVVSSTQQIAAITEEVTASVSEQQIVFESVNSSVEDLQHMSENLADKVYVFKVE